MKAHGNHGDTFVVEKHPLNPKPKKMTRSKKKTLKEKLEQAKAYIESLGPVDVDETGYNLDGELSSQGHQNLVEYNCIIVLPRHPPNKIYIERAHG